MNTLRLTSQFKKDIKRYKHKTNVIDKLEEILKLLVNGQPVPDERDKDEGIIKLVRFGSHSELF